LDKQAEQKPDPMSTLMPSLVSTIAEVGEGDRRPSFTATVSRKMYT